MAKSTQSTSPVSITGILGELLITAGVLVMLFLGWYVWLNDIVTGSVQQGAAVDVQRELQQEWEDDLATQPEPEPEETTEPGTPLAIGEGVDPATVLNSRTLGVGHYAETQMPGELGNVALAAHRNTWGGAFSEVGELQLGDNLYVETRDGWYQYAFRGLEYVWPSGVEVLLPVPQAPQVEPGEHILTLTTCNPRFSTAERMIAYAVLEDWHPRSGGAPAEISGLVEASSR